MPAEDRPIVFLIYTREDVPLRLDEAFLRANADCRIHLITTSRVTYVAADDGPAAGALVAHRFETLADITKESVIRLIHAVAGDDPAKIQVVTLSESSVDLSGQVKLELGLVDRDYSRFVRKDKMKEEAAAAGLAVPEYVVFDRARFAKDRTSYALDIFDRVGLPCFVKPIDLYGGMETMKIGSLDDFESWASEYMREDLTYEIDEFIDGTVYECDSIICNGVTEFCLVSVSSRPWCEIYNGHNLGVRTVRTDDDITPRLLEAANRINRHFMDGLSGVTCLEFFVRDGEIVFLEIGYRPAGAGLSASPYFLRSFDIRLKESHVLAQADPRWRPQPAFRNYVAWVIVPFPQNGGRLRDIHVPQVDCATEAFWNVEIGHHLARNDGINTYAGGILLWSDCYDRLSESYENMLNECRLEVEAAV